jgi:23S rRNA (pseudouridine1915-N3)-methyltransferase
MIRVLAVGKVKECRLAGLMSDYGRRIGRMASFEVIEVRDSTPEHEAEEMLGWLKSPAGHELVVAVDEKGTETTSEQLAELLGGHGSVTFLVGGPDGLGASARDRAHRTLKLSALTLTHEMARLLLIEQVYRALTILRNQPYHRR